MKQILAFLMLFVTSTSVRAAVWGYDPPYGPSNWSVQYPLCALNGQSPINIVESETVLNASLGQFERSYFDGLARVMLIRNTGHGLQVDVADGYVIDRPNILPAVFQIGQFHIHWGRPNQTGSEHTLNGNQYYGEFHVVHFNTKYGTLSNAADKSDGLAVVGFFMTVDYLQKNPGFEQFLAPVTDGTVRYDGQNLTFPNMSRFSVESLLPPRLSQFFQYYGSLTTPSCFESVFWTVFKDPIRISRSQADVLESMLFVNADGASPTVPLYGNFRPVQPLNGRVVTKSPECVYGGGSVFRVPFILVGVVSVLLSTALL